MALEKCGGGVGSPPIGSDPTDSPPRQVPSTRFFRSAASAALSEIPASLAVGDRCVERRLEQGLHDEVVDAVLDLHAAGRAEQAGGAGHACVYAWIPESHGADSRWLPRSRWDPERALRFPEVLPPPHSAR
jgi:hypothetical protein